MAARNTYHFAQKPASGGMPASENIRIVRIVAMTGLVADRPGQVADLPRHCRRLRRMARMKAKVPSVITR